MASDIFQLRSVDIKYRFKKVISNLSLHVERGQSLGLLGLNGAGKTSTIRVILGILRPAAGDVGVFDGKAGRLDALRRIGFAPEEGDPPDFLRVSEYLSFVAASRGISTGNRRRQIDEAMESFELEPGARIRTSSKGMKRRVVLAQAFLGNPEFVILDEPINGLDPLMIIRFRERLNRYREAGGTILYSSHLLTEVEKSCTHISILHKGELGAWASVGEMVSRFGSVESAFATVAGDSTT